MDFIDKIYIINLEHRKDRWEYCLKQLLQYNISLNKIERFNAIKPHSISDVDPEYIKNITKHQKWKRNENYIKGSYGCRQSHLTILNKYIYQPNKHILILEDDFLLTDNFINKFNKLINDFTTQINNWNYYHILYLGGNLSPKTKLIANIENIYNCNNVYSTVAYIFNSSYVNNIIEMCKEYNVEIDCCYCNLEIEKTYIIKPTLITQKPDYSNILNKNVNYKNSL